MKLIVRSRPKSYLQTKQQIKFKLALETCGIKKGITRAELIDKMINCIPQFFKEDEKEN